MTIAEMISALRGGKTITVIDRQSAPKCFKTACKASRIKNRVTVADYVSYDGGEHWRLISSESVYELRLADCAESLLRLGAYCELNVK